MRTYEDVKEALKGFEAELKRESGIKRDHYIIMGGNVNVVRKNIGEYALEKGTPVPMIWETARKKQAEFQEKCGDNIRLEIIKYSDWLIKNIEDCKKLMKCMEESLTGKSTTKSTAKSTELPPENTPESKQEIAEYDPQPIPPVIGPICTHSPSEKPENSDSSFRPVSLSCPSCPYSVKTCMICKFAAGINMDVFPWEVICNAPEKSATEK